MKKTHSTVLIVDAQSTKSLSVNTRLLYAVKPLLIFLFLATMVLASALGFTVFKYSQSHHKEQNLKAQVDHLQNATSAEIEAKISALSESERAITKLQTYLNERGVKAGPVSFKTQETGINDAAGGPEIELSKPIPYIGNFSEQTQALIDQAKTIPLGLPHSGELSSRFGYRANPFNGRGAEFHGGLDFRGSYGDPIRSTANGTVTFAGRMGGYGLVVIVQHEAGYETRYAHLSAITTKQGALITAGTQIGKLGSTGRSTGPHLHYEVRRHGERLDPEHFLSLNS